MRRTSTCLNIFILVLQLRGGYKCSVMIMNDNLTGGKEKKNAFAAGHSCLLFPFTNFKKEDAELRS